MVIRFFIVLLINVSLITGVIAQELVSSVFVGSHTAAELTNIADYPAENGVNLYKLQYTTTGIMGEIDTASGLLALPNLTDGEFPLLVYQHGTVDGRNDVPSKLKGGYELIAIAAGQGYISIGPDYLGLGDSKGTHPYVHAKTEATAAIDLIYATGDYLESVPFSTNDQLFITGYSQGGHAAMALHKELELYYADDFEVTAASPMSGPYSISRVMKGRLYSDDIYLFMAYFPYTLIGYEAVYGGLFEELSDVFKPEYVPIISKFYEENYSVFGINQELLAKVFMETGTFIVNKLLHEDVLEELRNNSYHPINLALADNDTYNWVPTAPIQLPYCLSDDQVPYQNSILADSFFVANGFKDIITIDVGSTFNHGQCVDPAVKATFDFFETFTNPSAISGLDHSDQITISPNPAKDLIFVTLKGHAEPSIKYNLIDINGKVFKSGIADQSGIQVSNLNGGVYFIEIKSGSRIYREKVLILR